MVRQSWLTAIAFWLSLLFAAGLFAAVALSPKLLALLTLSRQHEENQLRLVAVEKQVFHLQKVIDALQHDPNYARELARIDFETTAPDEQRIPVDSHLSLESRPSGPDLRVTPSELPWYFPLLQEVGNNRTVSNAFLGVAAVVVILAFTFFNERRPASECFTAEARHRAVGTP